MEKFGGICGRSYITIDNCYNKGTTVDATGNVTGNTTKAGGIVGYAYSSKVINCYNTGDITGTYYAGGIVGYGLTKDEDNCGIFGIQGCYNTGNIKSKTTTSSSKAGGICGYGLGTAKYKASIQYCYNYGTVTSSGSQSAGGIIGYCSYMSVSQCYNNGYVYLTNGTTYYPGAIIGYWYSFTSMSDVIWRSDRTTYPVGGPSTKREDYADIDDKVTTALSSAQLLYIVNLYNNAYVEDTENINNGHPILAWQAN